jgi:Bacterial DNA-binding protein
MSHVKTISQVNHLMYVTYWCHVVSSTLVILLPLTILIICFFVSLFFPVLPYFLPFSSFQGVSDGKAVKLAGFGIFEAFASKPRLGINPATLEPLNIPSRRRVRFRSSKAFKEIVEPSLKKQLPDEE